MIPTAIMPAMPFIGAAIVLALMAIDARRERETQVLPMPRWRLACLPKSEEEEKR